MSRTRIVIAVAGVVGAVIGSVLTYALVSPVHRIPTIWFEMAPPKGQTGVLLSNDAFVKSDIALPSITALRGSAKFVENEALPANVVKLGYKVGVDIAALDLTKVPAKYLEEKPIALPGGRKLKQLPLKQVSYDASFTFVLKDVDGFTISELTSQPHRLESGRLNAFQDFSIEGVSPGIAARTKLIVLSMNVLKCVTCDD